MVNYSQLIGEALEMMQRPSMIDSPSDGAPTKAPRWDLGDTEGYGGGNSFSWCSSMVSGYVGIYRRKKQVGGLPRGPRDRGHAQQGGALHPHGLLNCFLTCTPIPMDHVCSKKITPEGFILFGLCLIFLFCETLKQAKKQQFWAGPPVNRLVPKVI